MGALVEYWYYTGDDTYVELTTRALQFQVGVNDDYMPDNQTLTEGNDDQGFWALAVMSAAEYNFPAPREDEPSWLALAQAVFNTQAPRWDTEHCGGGLRWQVFQWNKGWDYKNSISQGTFFALAARLALFTGNSTYADWADKTWNWMEALEFIDPDSYYVYDGAHIPNNCTEIIPYQWTYNAGVFILGAAAMYNHTEDEMWKERLNKLLDGANVFFTGPEKNIMTEVACEGVDRCNIDQQSFKAYLSRWYAAITKWVPETFDVVMPLLRASAVRAAAQCTGGNNGRMCGLKWVSGKWDGTTGVGQQMAALEVTLSCMIEERKPAYRADNGGESKGNPSAGGDDIGKDTPDGYDFSPLSTGDKAGAWIVTVVILLCFVGGLVWLFLDEVSDKSALTQIKELPASTKLTMAAFVYGGEADVVGTATGAAAAAGGAAALRKRDSKAMNEKGDPSAAQKASAENSSSDQVMTPAPMTVGEVRTTTGGHHSRRASNMPIGWPNNPSMRSSGLMGPPSSERMSMHGVANQSNSGGRNSAAAQRESGSVSPVSEAENAEAATEARPVSPVRSDVGEQAPQGQTDQQVPGDDEIRPATPRQS